MMAPPPRKPTPTTTCDATRVTSIWTSVALRVASNGANACTEMRPNSAAPRQITMCVRNPAGWASISRSMPSAPPSPTASRTRSTITLLSSFSNSAFMAPSGGELLQRCPRQEEPLLAGVAESDDRLRLVTLPDHVDDDTFAEGVVPDVVADAQPGQARRPPCVARERSRHDGFAMCAPATSDGPVLAEHLDQLLGDLGKEPAGRVEVRAPEEHAAPRVAEIEPLARAGDADVAEPALLLELVGGAPGPHVRKDAVLEAGQEHHRELEPLGGVQRHQRDGALLAFDVVEIGDE